MDATEFKEARRELGLSASRMAAVLGLDPGRDSSGPRNVRRWEAEGPPATVARLTLLLQQALRVHDLRVAEHGEQLKALKDPVRRAVSSLFTAAGIPMNEKSAAPAP